MVKILLDIRSRVERQNRSNTNRIQIDPIQYKSIRSNTNRTDPIQISNIEYKSIRFNTNRSDRRPVSARTYASDRCSRRTDEWNTFYPIRLSVIHPYNHGPSVAWFLFEFLPAKSRSSISILNFTMLHGRRLPPPPRVSTCFLTRTPSHSYSRRLQLQNSTWNPVEGVDPLRSQLSELLSKTLRSVF